MSAENNHQQRENKKNKPQPQEDTYEIDQEMINNDSYEIEYVKDKKKSGKSASFDSKEWKKVLKNADKEIGDLKDKIKVLNDDLLRQLAEKENLRKRLEREKSEFLQYALSELMRELLTILDNFERALQNHTSSESFREGVEMIHKQIWDLLKKQGVRYIEIKDSIFDPNIHQAFSVEESDDIESTEIVEELQRGYRLHDRLLRPSLVKVRIPKKER